MPRPSDDRPPRRALAVTLVGLVGPAVVLLAIGYAIARRDGTSVSLFLRDPAAITRSSNSYGALSHVGVLLWAAAASICLFTAAVGPDRRWRRPLVATGLLSAAIGLDDLYQFHEELYRRVLDVSEEAVLLGYVAVIVVYALVTRRWILRCTDGRVLAVALLGFAVSVAAEEVLPLLDVTDGFEHGEASLVEEGAKLLGAAAWLGWCAAACADALHRSPEDVVDSLA